MESCNTTYYVLVVFVLLIAVLLLVNFMTKRALVYTLVAMAIDFVLGVYTLYLCLTLRQKLLTLSVIVKFAILVLIYVSYK